MKLYYLYLIILNDGKRINLTIFSYIVFYLFDRKVEQ